MRRNKVDKQISKWKKRVPGAKVKRGSASGAFYSVWRGAWICCWVSQNKIEWVRRIMKSDSIYHSRGKAVTALTRTWSDEPLTKRAFSRALREQGKREVREELQTLLEDEKREAEAQDPCPGTD